jgi:predicted site-specific integrase-resolvase
MPELSLPPAESCQEWFSVEQLEARSGISRWTWRRWCQQGKIASAKVSTRLLISRAEYERVMAEATRPRKGPVASSRARSRL